MKIFLVGLLLILPILACHKPNPATNERGIELLASRSFRAISLRQQRYDLADKMRFAQEAMGGKANQNVKDSINRNLQVYIKQKDRLLKESLALADTIRLQADSLMLYTNKTTQKIFKHKLDSIIRQKSSLRISSMGIRYLKKRDQVVIGKNDIPGMI